MLFGGGAVEQRELFSRTASCNLFRRLASHWPATSPLESTPLHNNRGLGVVPKMDPTIFCFSASDDELLADTRLLLDHLNGTSCLPPTLVHFPTH
jgi:hypothetical protein